MKQRSMQEGMRKAIPIMVAALLAVAAFAVVFAAADADDGNGFDDPLGAGETFTAVAAGNQFSLALRSDGTVWAWGSNGYGKLGIGGGDGKNTPQQVSGLTGITAIAAGYDSAFAIKSDGTLWAWGYNGRGQLGDGTDIDRNRPVQITTMTGTTAIASGHSFTIALKSDGTVWTWGSNSYGQLGDGGAIVSGSMRSTPQQVTGLSGITSIAAGYDCSFAVNADKTIMAWGDNTYGQLGINSHGASTSTSAPVKVHGAGDVGFLSDVKMVTAGIYHTTAVKNDGTVWSWGYNLNGQLGDGTTTSKDTPVLVSGLAGVVKVSARLYHTLAVKSDGAVYGWGQGGSGRLGNGTTDSSSTPVQVLGAGGTGFMTGVTDIGAGYDHSIILSNGTVWTFGYNGNGQLGIGTTTNSSIPVQVTFPASAGGGGGGGGISVLLIIAVVAVIAIAGAAVYFFKFRK